MATHMDLRDTELRLKAYAVHDVLYRENILSPEGSQITKYEKVKHRISYLEAVWRKTQPNSRVLPLPEPEPAQSACVAC